MTEQAPPHKLELEEQAPDGRHTLLVRGELDLASVPELEAAIGSLCLSGITSICLDLSGLAFMDSAGLRSLLDAKDKCEQHGCAFAIITAPGAVQRVLDLTGASDVLPQCEGSPSATV